MALVGVLFAALPMLGQAVGGTDARCTPVNGPGQRSAGCCHGTTSQPASLKLVDGPGFSQASCEAACTGGCQYYTFKLGWCTAWSASFSNCLPLETDSGDCGSDFSWATTYHCGWTTTLPTLLGQAIESADRCWPIGTGCCHGTTGQPANLKLVDGPGFTQASCEAACTGGCMYYTIKNTTGWCTAWSASFSNCKPVVPYSSDCGSDYSTATTYQCGWALTLPSDLGAVTKNATMVV